MKQELGRLIGVVCLAWLWVLPAQAQGQDGVFWLGRAAAAAREQSYSGTFVYRNGALAESARIAHLVDAGRELERLEVLDGSPREVLRNADEIKCYLPETRTLIIEKRARHSALPVSLPASLAGLNEHYTIRKGALERVADRDSQIILLEPRDALRYGHRFWVDTLSGLLLKAGLINERGESVETFAFTQLQVGSAIDRAMLKSRFAGGRDTWQVQHVEAADAQGIDDAWQFRVSLPGYRKVTGMRRMALASPGRAQSVHVVFSDGLATISVFIETLPEKFEPGMTSMGATHVYQRAVGGYGLVAMGELPRAALKKFADGIEPRKK
jgi:sigma-E factor negative regulatory protein RseB